MKAVINHVALSKELKKMVNVIKKNHIIPITSSVLFKFEKNKLTIVGTDLETTIISELACECSKPFSIAVEYSDISEVCNNAVAPIQIDLKEKSILVTSAKLKLTLSLFAEAEHFPIMPTDDFELEFNVSGDFFFNLSKANTCKHPDEAKINLNMAALDIRKDKVFIVGCDANVLFKKELPIKTTKEKIVMVPDMFVQSCKVFQDTKISVGGKYIKGENDGTTIISLLSVQKYADYNTIIPKDINYNITLNKEELKLCLRQISIASNLISKQCLIEFLSDKIMFVSQDADFGKSGESFIEIENNIDMEKICLNLKWITHLLTIIEGEEIEMSFTSPTKTVYLRPLGDNTELCLLQPLLLN